MLRSRIFGCDGLSLKVKGSSRAANCGALRAKARGSGFGKTKHFRRDLFFTAPI